LSTLRKQQGFAKSLKSLVSGKLQGINAESRATPIPYLISLRVPRQPLHQAGRKVALAT
jgi:hypothetical protein